MGSFCFHCSLFWGAFRSRGGRRSDTPLCKVIVIFRLSDISLMNLSLLPEAQTLRGVYWQSRCLTGSHDLTLVSSDERRSSCSSSNKRYSHSRKRGRYSHSNCCPTAKPRGCEGFLPGKFSGAKITKICENSWCLPFENDIIDSLRENKKGAAAGAVPRLCTKRKGRAARSRCYESTMSRPRKARRAPQTALEYEQALCAPAQARPLNALE